MFRLQDRSLTVGFGESDLNAPLGASMPGYFTDRKADGVLDPLMAKSVYLRHGKVEGALVVLDLVGLNAPEAARCRAAVSKRSGIDPRNTWIHATHSHTGTMIPRFYTSDAETIAPKIYLGTYDPAWLDQLPDRVADAVAAAKSSARATSANLGQTTAEKVAFYRRFKMKGGGVQTNAGRRPDALGPAGEVDPRLNVLRFPESKTLIVIYGMHPDVVGGTKYSADYPFHLCERVKETLGRDWGVLFLNAACGDINHIDVSNPNQKKGPEESRRLGRLLGEAALRAIEKPEVIEVNALGFASKRVPSRLRTVPEAEVKEAERILKEGDPKKATVFNGVHATAALVLGRTKDRELDAEISALRLGPVGLAAMPGEYFVELARIVMHDSPFETTRVIGLTNGSLGYIPHEAAYAEGGYESGYRSARFRPGTGELWARTAVELLQRLAMG